MVKKPNKDNNPARAMYLRGGVMPEQLGDPSTFRLTDDQTVVFGDGPLPFKTVFKTIEMGFRVTLQHIDGRRVTFKRVQDGNQQNEPFYGHSVMKDIMEMVKERDENRPEERRIVW